jgi:PiT family inorganic phosphate transporter
MEIVIFIIVLALIFDFINGFHDAANSIATIVSTKVLTPTQAVLWAAFFNFVAYFVFKEHGVANTVAKTVYEQFITFQVIISGLFAAIIWNLLTWYYGIPSSSSHTLIGGFAGAALAHAGFSSINLEMIGKTASFIVLAPIIGFFIAYLISIWFLNSATKSFWAKFVSVSVIVTIILLLVFKIETNVVEQYDSHSLSVIMDSKNFKWILLATVVIIMSVFALFLSSLNTFHSTKWFKRLQLVSSAAFSIGHGGNDAQKVMGIIWVTLWLHASQNTSLPLAFGDFEMPNWVPIACYTAIAAGTMSGGWKIVKTMGTKITKVTPFEGVAAETAGAITLFITEFLKIPVSTTHTITGSIMGVGATKRLSAVRWGITVKLFWAWILTIPLSAIIAIIVFYISKLFF